MANNLCYCLAVEKLLELEIPERAQWIRVLLTELTRLNSHLIWLGTHAMDIGALTVFLYTFREREEILRIFEMVSGQRMMTSYFRIGGLAHGAAAGSLRSHPGVHQDVPGKDRRVLEPADRKSNFLEPAEGRRPPVEGRRHRAGGDRAGDARVGHRFRPAARHPYSGYEKFQFEVPVSNDCDVWARYVLRLEEMRQSVRIIQQALDGMPGGRSRPMRRRSCCRIAKR